SVHCRQPTSATRDWFSEAGQGCDSPRLPDFIVAWVRGRSDSRLSADEVQRSTGFFVNWRSSLRRGGGFRGFGRGGDGGLRERSQFDRGTQAVEVVLGGLV